MNRRICIDPGHPSENGIGAARGPLTEVGIAWRVSVRLRDLLKAAGAAVTMTKSAEMCVLSDAGDAAFVRGGGEETLAQALLAGVVAAFGGDR